MNRFLKLVGPLLLALVLGGAAWAQPGKNDIAQASAAVKLLDADGRPVVGASLSGSWSGSVSRTSSATTDGAGMARFSSPTTRSKSGTFVFTVKGATLNGYSYAPALNTETSDSISR